MGQYVVNGLVQAAAALILASILYVGHLIASRVRGKDRQTWSRWLGLYLPPAPRHGLFWFATLFGIGFAFAMMMRFLLPDFLEMAPQTPQHQIATSSLATILVAAPVYAFVQTGFSEELIFRGVIGKRLVAWWGFRWGNLTQALIFGLLHVGLINVGAPNAGVFLYVFFGVSVTALAWVAGWAMEVRGNGSIFVPWLMHSAANLATVCVYIIAPVS